MLGLEMLDVLIGLITVYMVFGLACTAIVEAVTAFFGVRGRNLEKALKEFLSGDLEENKPFIKAFFRHPLVQTLSKDKLLRKGTKSLPSYIPPEIVSKVIEDLVTKDGASTFLPNLIDALPGEPDKNRIKGVLKVMLKDARGDVKEFRRSLEKSFNATMDRAGGWFKRYTQTAALVISAGLVIGANADTIGMVSSLAANPAARAKMVEVAGKRVEDAESKARKTGAASGESSIEHVAAETKSARRALDRAFEDMTAAGVRFGWTEAPKDAAAWLSKIVGLLISIFAVSLGAPFWFDVLQKFMKLRSAGVTHSDVKDGKKPTA